MGRTTPMDHYRGGGGACRGHDHPARSRASQAPYRWAGWTLLVLLLLISFPSLAPGSELEAGRQLAFARQELDQGRYEAALHSAESALRLYPTAYDAWIIKALAYEGLGNLKMAEVMLIAYGEAAAGLGDRPEVQDALARVQAAMEQEQQPRRTGPGRRTGQSGGTQTDSVVLQEVTTGAGAGQLDDLDPIPFKERVEAALSEGKCGFARAAALELTAAAPDKADGYRLLGDAARCDGSSREAVGAYRRFQALGGDDPAVDLLLRSLGANLASVVVTVVVPADSGSVPPRLRLGLPGEALVEQATGGPVTFADLPIGQELTLGVVGRGLEPQLVTVEPLKPGEARELELAPTWIGLGKVRVESFSPALCGVAFATPDGGFDLEPGGQRSVTAGAVTASVTNNYGTVDVPLEVQPGGEVLFDPIPWLPSELTLIELPAGASVRVFVEGMDGATAERLIEVPGGEGAIDPSTGVRVAGPQKVDSLVAGSAGIFVGHPILGEANATTALAPAEANATTFDWRSMPGLPNLLPIYEEWQADRLRVRREAAAGPAVSAALTIGSGIAAGVLWGLTATEAARMVDLGRQEIAAIDPMKEGDFRNQGAEAEFLRDRYMIAAGATSGVAVIGGVLTGVFGRVGHQRIVKFGEWDPSRAAE